MVRREVAVLDQRLNAGILENGVETELDAIAAIRRRRQPQDEARPNALV